MSAEKWAFDTNILVYLLDKDSPFHQSAVSAFSSAEQNQQRIYIAHQSFLELIQTLTNFYHLSLKKAISQAKKITQSQICLVHPLPQTLSTYFKLCKGEANPRLHFDLYLAATLKDNHVNTIVTSDSAGFRKSGLKIIPLKNFSSI